MANDRHSWDLATVIIAGAIGAAVGAFVALLFAPKPGEEFRAEVGEKAKEYADTVKQRATEMAETVKKKAADVKAQAEAEAEEEVEPEMGPTMEEA